MLCSKEGYEDFDIRYVGGFWVMLEFKKKETCKNLLANNVMDHWIVDKRPWDRNCIPPERLVWVDLEGLLLREWSKESFRKLMNKLGSIVHLDDALGEDVYKNRICILTAFQGIISEVVKVNVDDHILSVRIKEALGWTPSFSCDPTKTGFDNGNVHEHFHEEGEVNAYCEKEEESNDPFGIYDTLEKK